MAIITYPYLITVNRNIGPLLVYEKCHKQQNLNISPRLTWSYSALSYCVNLCETSTYISVYTIVCSTTRLKQPVPWPIYMVPTFWTLTVFRLPYLTKVEENRLHAHVHHECINLLRRIRRLFGLSRIVYPYKWIHVWNYESPVVSCQHIAWSVYESVCLLTSDTIRWSLVIQRMCFAINSSPPGKKWPPLPRLYFQMHFNELKVLYFD